METRETCANPGRPPGAEAPQRRHEAINDEISAQLASIWEQILGVESIGLDQDYFDLGGDSSLAVHMFAQIESVFKVKLPLATLYEAPTIEQLAAILRGEVSALGWSSVVAIQPSGSRPPFFCMHGAGGNVLNYRDLSKRLGQDQPFYGLQSQGLDGSCEPLKTIEEMAVQYAKEIKRVQPHGPYYLGGYCMGGTVAYEVAQQFVAQGERVALLALFDTMNWHKIPLNVWTKGSHSLQQWIFHALGFLALDADGRHQFWLEELAKLRSRIPVWKGMLLSRFGIRTRDSKSGAVLLAKIWENNDRASWAYVPKPYAGKITDIRPYKQYFVCRKPDLKWDRLAEGGQETIVLPVYPGSMLVEPFVIHLVTALRKCLDQSMDQERSSLVGVSRLRATS